VELETAVDDADPGDVMYELAVMATGLAVLGVVPTEVTELPERAVSLSGRRLDENEKASSEGVTAIDGDEECVVALSPVE
jgi:hypothetical protein